MHRFEFWRTHIFKAIEKVDGHLAHQRNQIGKVRNAKLCLANHIPVRDADWFKCHFRQLYFKADWSQIHFLSKLSFPFYAFVFTSAENTLLLPGLHVQWSARQQSLMKILSLREIAELLRSKNQEFTAKWSEDTCTMILSENFQAHRHLCTDLLWL